MHAYNWPCPFNNEAYMFDIYIIIILVRFLPNMYNEIYVPMLPKAAMNRKAVNM